MSKKIDINKLLSTGSAKQRVILLFYHYNLKEFIDKGGETNHKLPLTDKEAQALFNSFKSSKDIKVYNDYRQLNIDVLQHYKWLLNLYKDFEIQYWKYMAIYLLFKHEKFPTNINHKIVNINYSIEEVLITFYSQCLEYYTALKIYIKESGYKDKFIIEMIDTIYKNILKESWRYPVKSGNEEILLDLSEVEPDQYSVKDVLKTEFKIEYETEE